jgi:hypothetical protein
LPFLVPFTRGTVMSDMSGYCIERVCVVRMHIPSFAEGVLHDVFYSAAAANGQDDICWLTSVGPPGLPTRLMRLQRRTLKRLLPGEK